MEKGTKKICFVGAPSTGKSTLAKLLAEELLRKNHSVELIGEFARDYIIEHGTIEGPQAQLSIAKGQKEREKMALGCNPEFIVCDVPVFLSQVYFDFLRDKGFDKSKNKEVEKAGNIIRQVVAGETNSYDFVFFLPPEIPVREDGVRLYTDDIQEISDRIQKFLNHHDIKHYELRGTVEERAKKAFEIVRGPTSRYHA